MGMKKGREGWDGGREQCEEWNLSVVSALQ